jgi:hypothetical protein
MAARGALEAVLAPSPQAADPGSLPEPDLSSKGGGAPVRPKRVAPKAPPRPALDDDPPVRRKRGGGSLNKAAQPAPPAAPAPGGVSGARVSAAPVATATTESAPAGPTPDSLLAAKSTALHTCMVDHGAKADVTLTVEVASGKATVKLASKGAISAALDKCLKTVVVGIHFAGSVKLTRVVKP